MAGQEERVAIRAFARYIGVTDTYVKKQMFHAVTNPKGALKDCLTINEGNNRPMLFKEMALTEWVAAGLTIKDKAVLALVVPLIQPASDLPWGDEKGNQAAPVATTQTVVNSPILNKPNEKRVLSELGNYVHADMGAYEAKGMKEVFVAGKHELEYRKMLGQLVDKAEVYKLLFEYGQEIRSAFMQIPARIISQVMSSDNEREGREVMLAAIEEVLLIVSRGPKERTDEDETDSEEPTT